MDEKIFETALSSLAEAIALFAPNGALLWVNPAGEQLLGMSGQRLAGKRAIDIFRGAADIADQMERVAANGYAIFDNEAWLVNFSGTEFPVSVSIHPMECESGRGLAVAMRDLTGLKALERSVKLQEKVEETATLVAGIAHEIKNPLSGIRGAAQLIQGETDEERVGEYTSLIIRETDRINRLIIDLIELNHPAVFVMGPENIHSILDEAILGQKMEMEKRGISTLKLYDPSLPPVEGNRDRLVQIFLNLVKNAVEANPDGGVLTIRSGAAWRFPDGAPPRKDKKYATVEIIDEGSGIDEEGLRGLYTPFFSRKKGGAGLGLTVTLNLVRAHNGLLSVKNRKEKQGAEAAVYLPLA
ncbi:MAG: ATP-binding protein [Nitrospinota bacterium]|nr:ATP-binding protein [Nitrospinota bacterium]